MRRVHYARKGTLFPDSDSWTQQAACAGMPTEYWYAVWVKGTKPPKGLRTALTVCFRCPVRTECLSHALSRPGGEQGIWGGSLETHRRGKNITHLEELAEKSYQYALKRGFVPQREELSA